jgi:N-acyl-D-aspartate/D-glutamate deacylase
MADRHVLGEGVIHEARVRDLSEVNVDDLAVKSDAEVDALRSTVGAPAKRVKSGMLRLTVELLCTNSAKLFGLDPRKGTIAVGSDADIVVFDPERRHTITAAKQHSKSDYNLFEGTQVTGSPELVLLRGNVLVEGDELTAEPGSGQFIRRARVGEHLAPARAAATA